SDAATKIWRHRRFGVIRSALGELRMHEVARAHYPPASTPTPTTAGRDCMASTAADHRLAETDRLAIPVHMREALILLLQSGNYAAELRQDVWNFALEVDVLRNAKVSNSDLRWLSCKGYLQHALEMTADKDDTRSFRRVPPTVFTNRSCFVLTAAG